MDRLPLNEANQRQDEGGNDGIADRRIELPDDDPHNSEGDERQCRFDHAAGTTERFAQLVSDKVLDVSKLRRVSVRGHS